MNSLRVPHWVLALVASLLVTLACSSVVAQGGRRVEVSGSVQWIAANRLMLILRDRPTVLPIVPVNLTRVPLDQYRALRPGDAIAVVGVLSDDNRELIADTVFSIPEQQQSP